MTSRAVFEPFQMTIVGTAAVGIKKSNEMQAIRNGVDRFEDGMS